MNSSNIKKIIVSVILLVMCALPILAIGTGERVTIKWQKPSKERIGNESVQILKFENSVNLGNMGFLPSYLLIQDINPSEVDLFNFEILLKNVQTEPLSETELIDIYNVNSINANFEVNTHQTVMNGKKVLKTLILPFINIDNKIHKLMSFDFEVKKTPKLSFKRSSISKFKSESVLKNGKWVKVSTKQTGLHKLTYSEIEKMGINPQNIRVYGNGAYQLSPLFKDRISDDLVESPLWVELGSNGIFDNGDYILFYAVGNVKWEFNSYTKMFEHQLNNFTNESHYFLTSDLGPATKMEELPASAETPNSNITTSDIYDYIEEERENLLESGSLWLSDQMSTGSKYVRTFKFNDVITNIPVKVLAHVASRTTDYRNGSFAMSVNGDSLAMFNISSSANNNYGYFAQSNRNGVYNSKTTLENTVVELKYQSSQSDAKGWVNYIRVAAKRNLIMRNAQMNFCNFDSIGYNRNAQYIISNANEKLRVLDITDNQNPKLVSGKYQNNQFLFTANIKIAKYYLAFSPSENFPTPIFVENVKNQNLHGLSTPDLLIVTHPSLLEHANQLANMRRSEGLTVETVTTNQIYNEFSSGNTDLTAIRWFGKMLYDNGLDYNIDFKYLLLFGDGTFDNRATKEKTNNLIPTYQSDESFDQSETYVTDDYFGYFGNDEGISEYDDQVDIGIGRFPVRTTEEAAAVINKLKIYSEAKRKSIWKNSALFIGDDLDGGIHMTAANKFADKVGALNPSMLIKKVFLDAYPLVKTSTGGFYPSAIVDLEKAINSGLLILNYTGHGGTAGLTDERIVTTNTIMAYKNINALPLWVTATCEFSRYDLDERTSAGEMVFLNPLGGGIGLVTTTRLVYSSANETINNNFYDFAFDYDKNGNRLRLGDVMKLTKIQTQGGVNQRKFTLLGDPSLSLAFPCLDVKASAINSRPISYTHKDTLRALDKINLEGFVANNNGDTATAFNGVVNVIIYDKIVSKSTLSNNPESGKFGFNLWESVIFKGNAMVENGKFSINFQIPKDIDYTTGIGRIVFYAYNDSIDAAGNTNNIVVGGFSANYEPDSQGPEVKLYLNHTAFKDGERVNESPLLIANIKDNSGINSSGTSIGHDIVMITNNDPSTMEILNDNYIAPKNADDWGEVRFKLKNLTDGNHTILFRAWDIYNNSSTKTISFVVKSSQQPTITSLNCYPNPASNHTNFKVEHNRPDEKIKVEIEVFTTQGEKIASLSPEYYSENQQIEPIFWDLKSGNGNRITKGLYLYRVKISTSSTISLGETKKLMVQ